MTIPSERPAPPLGDLKYLYVGTSRFDEDREYYRDVVGAKEIRASRRSAWRRVCSSFSLARALLTYPRAARQARLDRSPAPSLAPAPAARGSSHSGDSSRCELGNELAIFGNVRPDALSGVRPR
jgi:hypothetical protein